MTRLPLFAPVAVVGLAAVVAAATRTSRAATRGDEVREVPSSVVDYGYSVAVVILVLGALWLAWILLAVRPGGQAQELEGFWRLVAIMGVITAVAVFGLVRADFAERGSSRDPGAAQLPGTPPGAAEPTAVPAERDPAFRWWVAAVAAAGVAAAVAARLARRRRRERERVDERRLPAALAAVFEETLDDLRREPDARRAVIAAYARMELALARHGFARRPSEAPLEYLARILVELDVRPGSVEALTTLFAHAKFSPHEIDLAMKEEAIDALGTVRDDLRAAA